MRALVALDHEIGASHEQGREGLRHETFDIGEHREPYPEPLGQRYADLGCREPAGELHFLDLLANHDHQHDPEQDAGDDQHLLVGDALVGDEGQDGDDRTQEEPYGRSLEDREGTDLEPEALQEEHYLEAFPVDGRESKERKAEEGGAFHPAEVFEYPLSPAVVEPDPTCPVDLVEEPGHYRR